MHLNYRNMHWFRVLLTQLSPASGFRPWDFLFWLQEAWFQNMSGEQRSLNLTNIIPMLLTKSMEFRVKINLFKALDSLSPLCWFHCDGFLHLRTVDVCFISSCHKPLHQCRRDFQPLFILVSKNDFCRFLYKIKLHTRINIFSLFTSMFQWNWPKIGRYVPGYLLIIHTQKWTSLSEAVFLGFSYNISVSDRKFYLRAKVAPEGLI